MLELGTGIGHTAALLAHRLGERNVTSVEIDSDLHHHAAIRLHAAGVRPALVLGDSIEHCDPDGYDRVLVAHHVDAVPPAWVTAMRPGGRLLVGLRGSLGAGHHALLHHQINTTTGTPELTGRFLDWTAALPGLRHPARQRSIRRPLDPDPGPVRTASTRVTSSRRTPRSPCSASSTCHPTPRTPHVPTQAAGTSRTCTPPTAPGSRSVARWTGAAATRCAGRGSPTFRGCWDAAWVAFQDLAAPCWTTLGLTATTRGTRLWHEPTGTSWPLAGALT